MNDFSAVVECLSSKVSVSVGFSSEKSFESHQDLRSMLILPFAAQ